MRRMLDSRDSRYSFLGWIVGYLSATFSMAYLGPIGKHLYLFGTLYFFSFLFLLLLLRTFPRDYSPRVQLIVIFSVALIVRMAFLPYPASHDVNRYIWEGSILNNGLNPYLHAPNDPALEPFINEIWHGINPKHASACYPPLSMLLFRLGAFISPTPFFFKILVLFFDLATVWVLARLLRWYRLPPSRLVLYALNPLVLVYVAGEGHLDAIQGFFICLCFLLFARKREGLGFLSLGCAVMSKYFSVLLVPFLMSAKNWRKSFYLLGALVALYLPFWESGSSLFTSLVPFGTVMHYNDSITVLLRGFLGAKMVWGSAILLGVCLSIIFLTVHEPLRSSYLAVGCLLLLLGTLHPWYLVLITPFLLFFPSRAWLYLHCAVLFTFPVMHVEYLTGVFQEIHLLKLFEYIPFYGLLVWGVFRKGYIFPERCFKPATSVSVVIPTLNESENIGGCLENLQGEEDLMEAIVVDGGSTDGTRKIASGMGYRVLRAEKGRGNQIKTGISSCRGDVILILHSDCLIRRRIPTLILRELNGNPQCIGGAVGMEYSIGSIKKRFIAWLNNARARLTGISFGDQAQFLRREAVELMGGFPDLKLMEDVELSMRLKEHGVLCFIRKGVIVSDRRWSERGFWPTFGEVVWWCFSFLVQRRLGIGQSMIRRWYDLYYSRESAEQDSRIPLVPRSRQTHQPMGGGV